ncbi:MAG: RsmE family RNA methyltransferase [Tepidisphaeraceae bacterium]
MRRIYLARLAVGRIELPRGEARHVRDVLRLTEDREVEAFDAAGRVGRGRLIAVGPGGVAVQIERIEAPPSRPGAVSVASAVPKSTRADWMIEKLSELGVDRFIPLASRRSVVRPQEGKLARWRRVAEQSAKQSRRVGIMQIEPVVELPDLLEWPLEQGQVRWCLSTGEDAVPMLQLAATMPPSVMLLVGPEGGWAEDELALLAAAGVAAARLTSTVLRIETAAVAAAAIVQSALTGRPSAATIHGPPQREGL